MQNSFKTSVLTASLLCALTLSANTWATQLSPVLLGASGDYAILAETGISTVPTSSVTGHIAVSPVAATYITGFALSANGTNVFSTSTQVVGKVYASNYAVPTPSNLTTAVLDMQTAYNDAAGRPTPDFLNLNNGALGGLTLEPGLYNWGSSVTIPLDVTLTGGSSDIWILQISGDLMVSAAKRVNLSGGALAKNIFWQVAGQTTIGVGAHFEGVVLSKTSITLLSGASMNGRALSQTAVTLQSATITQPSTDLSATITQPPTDLSATPTSETQINLSWPDTSDDETGFKVFQGGTLIHTTAANATSYNVTGLSCNTGYAFTVVATNSDGDSSAVATTPATTTTSACSAPTYPTDSGGDLPPPQTDSGGDLPPPQPDYYQLNIDSPSGRVYTSPAGIDCNKGQGVCDAIFKSGQLITLNTQAPEGLIFAGWDGSSVCSEGSFNIYNSLNCNAIFYGDPNYVETQPETNPSSNTDTVNSEQPKTYIHSFSVRANIAAKSACNLTQMRNPNEVLVAGFILRGSGSERVLINARGLEAGVEPRLLLKQTIIQPNGILEAKGISENANWETHANAQNIPLAYRPKQTIDAALLLDLPAGIYTVTACMNSEAIVDFGIALVSVTPLDNKLSFSNASGRGFVGGGANDVIAGFTVLGTEQRQVQLNGKALGTNIIDTALKIGRIYFDPVSYDIIGEEISGEISNVDDSSSNVIMNFTPGSYTIVLSSKSGKGLGIVSMDFVD